MSVLLASGQQATSPLSSPIAAWLLAALRASPRLVRLRLPDVFLPGLLFTMVLGWPTSAQIQPLSAILLTARAELPDPNFRDSTALVLNNIGPTPMGFILNRPTRMEVWRLFPEMPQLMQFDDKVYFGGPVAVASVSFLLRADAPPGEHAVRILDNVYLSTNLELLQKLLSRESPMEGLRIFIGYSAWAPGQLENEVGRGDWTLAPADADAVFAERPQHEWPDRSPGAERRT
jgi:putative transcriptional regulator